MQSPDLKYNDLNTQPHSNQNHFNCIETAKDNKHIIMKFAKYCVLMLILGYSICDIVDIQTNKKNANKEAKTEEVFAITFAALSSITIACMSVFDIKKLKKLKEQENAHAERFIEIPQSPTPMTSFIRNYCKSKTKKGRQDAGPIRLTETEYAEL